MIRKYKKKPIIIEAVQFTGDNFEECCKFVGTQNLNDGTSEDEKYIGISTLEGDHNTSVGDYIIKGVQGEFYPCKPDIFEATYELVNWLSKP